MGRHRGRATSPVAPSQAQSGRGRRSSDCGRRRRRCRALRHCDFWDRRDKLTDLGSTRLLRWPNRFRRPRTVQCHLPGTVGSARPKPVGHWSHSIDSCREVLIRGELRPLHASCTRPPRTTDRPRELACEHRKCDACEDRGQLDFVAPSRYGFATRDAWLWRDEPFQSLRKPVRRSSGSRRSLVRQ